MSYALTLDPEADDYDQEKRHFFIKFDRMFHIPKASFEPYIKGWGNLTLFLRSPWTGSQIIFQPTGLINTYEFAPRLGGAVWVSTCHTLYDSEEGFFLSIDLGKHPWNLVENYPIGLEVVDDMSIPDLDVHRCWYQSRRDG